MAQEKVFSAKEWFADVKGDIELSDEQTQAMETLLANEDVVKNIGNSVLRQSDYSRKSDALQAQRDEVKAAQDEVERLRTEATEFVTKQKDRDHNNLTLHDQLVQDLAEANKRLENAGEETLARRVTEPVKEEEPEVKYLSIDDYRALEAERDQNAINYSNTVIQLANQHREVFDENFDPEPVVKHATEKGMTLKEAYTDMYSEQYAAKDEEKIQARIDAAVQEATIEARSKNDFPEVETGPQRVQGLNQAEEDKLKTEDDRTAAAMQGLAEIRTGKRAATDHWN